MTGPLVARPGPCPTCGRSTDRSEEWSTGQCDDCYMEDHVFPRIEGPVSRTRVGPDAEHVLGLDA